MQQVNNLVFALDNEGNVYRFYSVRGCCPMSCPDCGAADRRTGCCCVHQREWDEAMKKGGERG